MPKYEVTCFWSMSGRVTVEAEDIDSACSIVEDGPLPDGDYVDGSFEIVREFTDCDDDDLE